MGKFEYSIGFHSPAGKLVRIDVSDCFLAMNLT